MSDRSTALDLHGVALTLFIVLKLGATVLADWSWWWVLWPIVPDIVAICKHVGWM